MRGRVGCKTIIAAKEGDTEAMYAVLRHYRGYINHFSRRWGRDRDGRYFPYIDGEIRQRIESRLMYAICFVFDIERTPQR